MLQCGSPGSRFSLTVRRCATVGRDPDDPVPPDPGPELPHPVATAAGTAAAARPMKARREGPPELMP